MCSRRADWVPWRAPQGETSTTSFCMAVVMYCVVPERSANSSLSAGEMCLYHACYPCQHGSKSLFEGEALCLPPLLLLPNNMGFYHPEHKNCRLQHHICQFSDAAWLH